MKKYNGCLMAGNGLFSLEDSDHHVGSFFSIKDLREILELDKLTDEKFEAILLEKGLLDIQGGKVDERKIKRPLIYELRAAHSSATQNKQVGSFDELVLMRLIYRTLPGVKIIPQYQVNYSNNKSGKARVDFKIDYHGQTRLLEFNGPQHYNKSEENPRIKAKQLEAENDMECVIWPYWIQRCASNVRAIFDKSITGYGAMWSTMCYFGSFIIDNPSDIIEEETKQFNAIRKEGIGYFYGADEDENRSIPAHPIVAKILSGEEKVDVLIPRGGEDDKRFWLPRKLWHLV